MTTVAVVQVPVKYLGRELKAPFLLFTGWTVEERKAYAKDLRKIKSAWFSWGYPLCRVAGMLVERREIAQRSKVVLKKTLIAYNMNGNAYLPDHVFQQTELSPAECFAFRGKWLDMQIGMIDVPDMGF